MHKYDTIVFIRGDTMEVQNYSKDKFETFVPLHLGNITHTESDLYFMTYKKQNMIFKKLYVDFGNIFSNKLYTLSALIDNKERFDIEEIVFPKQLITISKDLKGFIMPYISNINFSTFLSLKNKTLQDKINCFRQINDILLKMKSIREKYNIDFYINDFHEENILYNVETNSINLVDIDSCRILNNKPFASKYLTPMSLAALYSKYNVSETDSAGYIVADQNSDIYCYAIMVLNFLCNDKFYKFDYKTVEEYFEYLKKIGFSNEFVDKFNKPFIDDVDNEFLGDYLEEINESNFALASFPKFKEYVLKKY